MVSSVSSPFANGLRPFKDFSAKSLTEGAPVSPCQLIPSS